MRISLFIGVLAVAFTGSAVLAQATKEQEEACAPDAVRLCASTIPDIPKTTACMKAHVADLSPRCRTMFNEASGGGTKTVAAKPAAPAPRKVVAAAPPAKPVAKTVRIERDARAVRDTPRREDRTPRHVARIDPQPAPRAPRPTNPTTEAEAVAPTPAPQPVYHSRLPGLDDYAAHVAADCRAGYIDPFTCHNALDALGMPQ
jgi:hypothetical protein